MSRSLLASLTLLLGCTAPPHGRPGPTDSTPTETVAEPVTGPRIAARAVWIEESGPTGCADPSTRATSRFRRLQSAALPTSEKRLWGAGALGADFTGDGHHDLFLVGELEHSYWVNVPASDPEAVALSEVHPTWLDELDLDFAVGGIPVDFDDDGWLDMVITRWDRPNALLLNLDGAGFADVTPAAMRNNSRRTQSVSAGDIDGDGDLDLIFGSYAVDPEDGFDTYMPPAEPAELYRNDGGGQWTDLSDRLPPEVHDGYTFMTGLYDLDGDLLPELIVSNDFGKIRPSVIATNLGDFQFLPDTTWHPDIEDMGMGVGDLNGDEVPDFLISSWRHVSLLLSGEASGLDGLWIDGATAAGITVQHETNTKRQDFGWGMELVDIDNDADLDAVGMFGSWAGWTNDLNELDALWLQTGPLAFEERAADPEWNVAEGGDGRAVLALDLNNDGWLDLVKRNVNQISRLHLSHCGTEGWLRVELAQDGPNSRAVGARVRVITGDQSQIRWITAGSTGLYTGQPPEAHFGLGDADSIDALQIEWPDGQLSEFQGLSSRQRIRVVRGP